MQRVLIAGCGYVGREAARLFTQAGYEVIALVRSQESALALAALSALSGKGFEVRTAEISSPALTGLSDLKGIDLIIHCASSSGGGAESYRQVYLDGCRNLLGLTPARFIFTSSTSVYAQNDGSWVTEQSPTEPDRETGQILRQSEDLVLQHPGGIVARLAGIYGPGRSMLLRKMLDGTALLEDGGQRFLNQIHRDDAASALFFLATQNPGPGIYNVADAIPLTQLDSYRALSEHFQLPLPASGPVDLNRKRGVTNKRVSSEKLRAAGWQPQYPSFQDAVRAEAILPG